MSIEYPPTSIPTANTWTKDANDTITGYVGTSSGQTIRTYKTTLSSQTYGNGEYRAWMDDTHGGYVDGDTFGVVEWPASGAFDKTSSSTYGWHTGRYIWSTSSDISPPSQVGLDMPQAINLTSYSIQNRPEIGNLAQSPRKWELYGRNEIDGNETLLDSQSAISWSSASQVKTFNTTITGYYSSFFLKLYRSNSSVCSFMELRFYGTPLALEYPPTSIPAGNTWVKDGNDRYNSDRTYKTVLTTAKYGNGEYKAFATNSSGYSDLSTYENDEWAPSQAFDKLLSINSTQGWGNTTALSNTSDAGTPQRLGLELPQKIKLVSYSIQLRSENAIQAPTKWNLYGRNGDGTTETLIDTQASVSWTSGGEVLTFYVDGDTYYSDYLFDFLRGNAASSSISVTDLKLYGNPQDSDVKENITQFSELSNLEPAGPLSVQGSGIGIPMSQFKDLVETTSISMSQIQDPTFYTGHGYIGGNGDTTRIYFPTKFSTTPAVFISSEPHNPTMGVGATTAEAPYIIQTTPEYFEVQNDEDVFTNSVIHWMAVKPGTGTIHGLKYDCQLVDTSITLGATLTYTYVQTFSSVAFSLGQIQTNNNSSNMKLVTLTETTTAATLSAFEDNDQSSAKSNNEVIGYFAIEYGHVANKIDTDIIANSLTHTGADVSLNSIIFNPVCILRPEDSTDTMEGYIRSIRNNQINMVYKETPSLDGTVPATTILRAMVITGTYDTWKGSERGSRPLIHLDANSLNTRQGMTSGDITRWYSESQSQVKYYVGQGNLPSLGSDSNGYYVNFNGSNEYFNTPNPIYFRFTEPISSNRDKGITAFCVFNFGTGNSYERIFDFGNGQNVDNILWARDSTTTNLTFRIQDEPNGNYYTVTGGIVNSQYKVYAVVYDNVNLTCNMYVNNVSQTVAEVQETYTPTSGTRSNCYIGNSNWAADADTNGQMRELIVFNDVLTSAQISSINTHLISKWNIS